MGSFPSDAKRKPPVGQNYSAWSNMRDPVHRRFTAVYVCPFTGEKYLSGTLQGVDDPTSDHMFYDPARQLLLSNLRGSATAQEEAGGGGGAASPPPSKIDLVWYRSKKRAEEAAAGRALDCLRHRAAARDMDGASGGRYCAEEPYLRDEAPGGWQDISEAAKAAEEMLYDGATPLKPYNVPFALVPEGERLTDFYSIAEMLHENEEWRKRHQDARKSQTATMS